MNNLTTPQTETSANKGSHEGSIENKPKALGRGLAALINPALQKSATVPLSGGQKTSEIPAYAKLEMLSLSLISPNPDQPRKIFDEEKLKELSASLKEQGLVQPIVVRPKKDGRYEIVAGERRWRAAQLAELGKIPAIIRDDKNTVLENDLASLVENLQREQLSPLELASAYDRTMRAHQMTQEQLSQKIGVSRVSVANTLRLLKLPEEVKALLSQGKITEGHARSLLSLENQKQMGEIAQKIVLKTLSVRQAEEEVRSAKTQPAAPSGTTASQATAAALEREKLLQQNAEIEAELRQLFGTKVTLRQSAGRGALEIYFTGSDSLHRILHLLRGLKS